MDRRSRHDEGYRCADEKKERSQAESDVGHSKMSIPRLSYLHNLCRCGDTNEWSSEPPDPGWTGPLTVSGLTRVGRGEWLVRASFAHRRHVFYIRSSAGCQRFLAANWWIANRCAVTTIMRGKLMARSRQAGQLVARRTDESVRRVADECERQVADLSARAAGPRDRVALDRAKTEKN